MAVVVTRTKNTPSPSRLLTRQLTMYGIDTARRQSWRGRKSENDGNRAFAGRIHLAESESHKAWVKETLAAQPEGESPDSRQHARHEAWLQKTLTKTRQGVGLDVHEAWLAEQRAVQTRCQGTANCHEAWLADMTMPADLMDGGKPMEVAAAEYCQAIWRGRAVRLGRAASILAQMKNKKEGG